MTSEHIEEVTPNFVGPMSVVGYHQERKLISIIFFPSEPPTDASDRETIHENATSISVNVKEAE